MRSLSQTEVFDYDVPILLPPKLTRSQSLAALMLRAGVSSVFTASAVFLDTFPRLAAESTPRSTYARPLSRFSCEASDKKQTKCVQSGFFEREWI